LNAGSDLDLIVIYDPLDEETSKGRKPLPSRLYYARLTQALITALSAPMAQGKLFDVDMRLRPSGNQGPVATSWPSFQSYQREEAWVWEHLALTRAAVIAGPDPLAQDVSAFRKELIAMPRDLAQVADEVAQMRRRIQEAKTPDSPWDVKIGPGRLQEIELVAQAGALLSGDANCDTPGGLRAAAGIGLLDENARDVLSGNADFYAQVHTAVRLLSARPLQPEALGPSGEGFLLRTLGQRSMSALEAKLTDSYQQNDALMTAALAPFETQRSDT
jgi:glutamate-ammonia-ligase adenylyltransferase